VESSELREILSYNIKKERKKHGLTQEKLAEIAELSSQTINDIEGCRMWVSDKTITKLANILGINPYQLLVPAESTEAMISVNSKYLTKLENNVIYYIKQQFKEASMIIDANNKNQNT